MNQPEVLIVGGAFERTRVMPEWIDHAVIGNVLPTSADAIYGARDVALKAGVPVDAPALTVNRSCGSGVRAAVSGGRLMRTVLLELRRRGKKRGLATACIGGGQGIAAIVEVV